MESLARASISTVTISLGALALSSVCAAQIGVVGPSSTVRRISLDSNGLEVARWSAGAAISSDGRFTVMFSHAALVPQDTNGRQDVYLFDRVANSVELVSVDLSGNAGNGDSFGAMGVSDDGRFVAFSSYASDLVANDTCIPCGDAFVRDRMLGVTYLVTVNSAGQQGIVGTLMSVGMSQDGRFTTYCTTAPLVTGDINGDSDVFVHDLLTGTTELVSVSSSGIQGNAGSGGLVPPQISGDGNLVVFPSDASNLVAGDTNGLIDVFARDRAAATTELISVGVGGQPANGYSTYCVASSDGRFVVFDSTASNLVANDTNGTWDIFVRDRLAGTTARASVSSAGGQGNGPSTAPQISPDGRFVGFSSAASNLVAGDSNGATDAFLHDTLIGTTTLISTSTAGVPSNAASWSAALSRDARVIAFTSVGSTLVAGDTNGVDDVFLRECPIPQVYCTAQVNSLGCASSIHSSGVPQASSPVGFVIGATNVLNNKSGVLVYSTNGSAAFPFHGGTLCIQAPFRRTAHQFSGGSATGSDCTGSFAYDFNALIASGANPALIAGQQVWTQYWSRDPGFTPPNNSNLTNALTFVIDP